MALIGQAVSEKKIFENGGRRTDGRTPDHGHPISSPCEPNSSGEIMTFSTFPHSNKMTTYVDLAVICQVVSEKKMFEYHGHIHVHSPKAGADKPLGTKCFHKHKSSVHLHTPSKFTPI